MEFNGVGLYRPRNFERRAELDDASQYAVEKHDLASAMERFSRQRTEVGIEGREAHPQFLRRTGCHLPDLAWVGLARTVVAGYHRPCSGESAWMVVTARLNTADGTAPDPGCFRLEFRT